jgi:hypothetical protein
MKRGVARRPDHGGPTRNPHTAAMPPFDTTLVLPIEPARWAPPDMPVTIDGLTLEPKPELHVTLIGGALGQALRASFEADWLDAALEAAFNAHDWRFARSHRQWLLRRPYLDKGRARVAHSIIEPVEMPAMAPFHRELGRWLGRELPVPPPHVTLYVAGRKKGIGVASHARLRTFTVRDVTGFVSPKGTSSGM